MEHSEDEGQEEEEEEEDDEESHELGQHSGTKHSQAPFW
tara:strand:- start:323 stop:439 length:117 start_codon:yes stop_codon:yes gene_type:complete